MKITGKIFDKDDMSPLPGANINMMEDRKVTTFAVNSDESGNFSLESNRIEPNTLFRISFIGYTSQTFSASELQNKSIYLKYEPTLIEEVVINVDRSKSKTGKPTVAANNFKEHFVKNKKAYIIASAIVIMTGSFFLIKKNI